MFLDEKKLGEEQTRTWEPWRLVLLNAADYIERNGWCQHAERLGTRACVIGALKQVARGEVYWKAGAELRQGIGASISFWNDEPGQTVENVLETLRSFV